MNAQAVVKSPVLLVVAVVKELTVAVLADQVVSRAVNGTTKVQAMKTVVTISRVASSAANAVIKAAVNVAAEQIDLV